MKRLLLVLVFFVLLVPFAFAAMPDNQDQQQSIKKGSDSAVQIWKVFGENSDKIIEFGKYARTTYDGYLENGKDDYFLLGYCATILNTMKIHKQKLFNVGKQNQVALFYYDKTQLYCSKTNITTDELGKFLGIDPKILQQEPQL